MKGFRGNTITVLDTGKIIRGVMKLKNFTKAGIARKLGRKQSTVSLHIQKTSLQTYILWEFGVALNHNFFADLAAQFAQATGTPYAVLPQTPSKNLKNKTTNCSCKLKFWKRLLNYWAKSESRYIRNGLIP